MWDKLLVVELASVLAGPLVGSFFAELGAKVIKIENRKTNGDVTRQWKLPKEEKESSVSAYYASANYGKESIFLDLTNKEDYAKCMDYIQQADIVLQNYRPGVAKKLGLDGKSLLEQFPSLIVGEIGGFPEGDERVAFDVVLQAESGYLSMNGTPESGPVKMPVALIDVLAAHHLKEAILIALLEKTNNKKGQIVRVSLYDAALASLVNQASNYLMNRHIPEAMGTLHPNIAPYGEIMESLEGKKLVLAIGNDKQYSHLWQYLIGSNAVPKEYRSNHLRLKNRVQMGLLLSKAFAKLSAAEIDFELKKRKIPFGWIKHLGEVLEESSAKHMIQNFKIEEKNCRNVKTLLK